jgi:hypothetical protein
VFPFLQKREFPFFGSIPKSAKFADFRFSVPSAPSLRFSLRDGRRDPVRYLCPPDRSDPHKAANGPRFVEVKTIWRAGVWSGEVRRSGSIQIFIFHFSEFGSAEGSIRRQMGPADGTRPFRSEGPAMTQRESLVRFPGLPGHGTGRPERLSRPADPHLCARRCHRGPARRADRPDRRPWSGYPWGSSSGISLSLP